jgi:hypothetical protein
MNTAQPIQPFRAAFDPDGIEKLCAAYDLAKANCLTGAALRL